VKVPGSMTRHIVLGNQSMLVNIDRWLQVRDVYFPYVGQENHLGGHAMKVGVFADGRLSWVNGDGWERRCGYRDGTLSSDSSAKNAGLGVELGFRENVHPDADILIRKITVRNTLPREREIRVFFNSHFHISGTSIGDTAAYQMDRNVVIHYKGPRYFLISLLKSAVPQIIRGDIDDYAIGRAEEAESEGTHRDAEDGALSKNPIAQGIVDSTIAAHLRVGALSEESVYFYLAAGTNFEQVFDLHDLVFVEGPDSILTHAEESQRSWADRSDAGLVGLDPVIVGLFKRSLLIIRSQTDRGGAILAANDSEDMQFHRDTYSYMWPRDGALAASAMIRAGYPEFTKPFFGFCRRLLWAEKCLLHKYNPDGTLGSSWHPWVEDGRPVLPIQEDETALVVSALLEYYEATEDLEFLREMYSAYVKKAAEFMNEYCYPNGLPQESYDLWEERRGIFAFTASAVHSGLAAAGRIGALLGDGETARMCADRCARLRKAITDELYDEEAGVFRRGLSYEGGDLSKPVMDNTADSSVYGLFEFGVLPADDERLARTMDDLAGRLWVGAGRGGVARYAGDRYQRKTDEAPGNPWLISTLWLAKWRILRAGRREDLEGAMSLINWVAGSSLETGVMPEQTHPLTGEPLSVAPLTWSHAEFVDTVIKFQRKRRQLGKR
jgi:GH15 family glucan-1,4-alpha-glucosidase